MRCLAVGLALIYGVSHLINFAHGSIYMVGAYVGWLCVTYLGMPLPPTLLVVVVGCGLLGMLIERLALRPLQSSPRIAPLLSTIGVGLVLDQVAQLLFTPDPRGIASQVPSWRIQIGGGTIGALDLSDRCHRACSARYCCICSCASPSWAGPSGPRRWTAMPPSNAASTSIASTARCSPSPLLSVVSAVFSLACTTTAIDPNMGYQAGLKGIVAQMIGGMGNVPGAIAGSLLLGLIESYGIAHSRHQLSKLVRLRGDGFSSSSSKPNGIFNRGRRLPPEPLTGTFHRTERADAPARCGLDRCGSNRAGITAGRSQRLHAADARHWLALRHLGHQPDPGGGHGGQISLGHAGLLAIGAYASALLAIDLKIPVAAAIICAGVMTAVLGTLDHLARRSGCAATTSRSRRSGVGEIVTLTSS